MKLFLATANVHKIQEIKDILSSYPLTILTQKEYLDLPEVPETGHTFAQNAILKATEIAIIIHMPTLSDDSGLVIPALNGAPGIYSARYAGEGATDEEKCRQILKEMADKTDRSAYFECVIALALPDQTHWTWTGRCDGEIIYEMKGENGFGYDPIFGVPSLQKTFAELLPHEKNQLSHRACALKAFKKDFTEGNNFLTKQFFGKENHHA